MVKSTAYTRPTVRLPNKRFSQGVSMVEVLVAMLVFATGVLGIAGMQLTGLNLISHSHSISFATYVGADMADRMRANSEGVRDGYYDAIDGTETDPSCSSGCTPSQQAQLDAYEVMQQLNAELAEASFSVTKVASSGHKFKISISWYEVGKDSKTLTTKKNKQTHEFIFYHDL